MYNCELMHFINSNFLNDVFINHNEFKNKYNIDAYYYLRVSTEKQEFGRQILQLYEWAKKKDVKIFIENIFCDKYTGKRTTREEYQKMHNLLKKSDFLIVAELNRLGRNWDNTKKEWQYLTDNDINVIILDNDLLSAKLPNEPKELITLEYKFVRDIVFNAINYVASKKIEEVSRSTKAGLKKAKMQGKKLGRTRSERSSINNFINVLEYMLKNDVGMDKATFMLDYPVATFKLDIQKFYKKYNTKDYKIILESLKKEMELKKDV